MRARDVRDAMRTVFEIPEHVERDGGTDAGERMHLAGVAEFFFYGGSSSGLQKFAEACAGIGKSPGGNFNAKTFQRIEDFSEGADGIG